MDEKKMVVLLYRLERQCNRNGLFVIKKLLDQELKNLKGITEKVCKKRKIREDYCNYCDNINCNLNLLKESETEKEIMNKIYQK
ncbi:MAG: hypothetical protein K6B70_05430 [Clostridia bacterium]|nr:hypothetical protein [Clostridia bacterium]